MRSLLLLALFACGRANPHNTFPGSSEQPSAAAAFWCAPTKQCFTAEADCKAHGDCSRLERAWCVPYNDDKPRFMCGVDQRSCLEHSSSRLNVTGECIEHKVGS